MPCPCCWALGKRLPSTKDQLFIHKLAQNITQEGRAPLPSSWLCSKTQDGEMDAQQKMPYNYQSGITWLYNITLNTESGAANSSPKSRNSSVETSNNLWLGGKGEKSCNLAKLPLSVAMMICSVWKLTHSVASHCKIWQVIPWDGNPNLCVTSLMIN